MRLRGLWLMRGLKKRRVIQTATCSVVHTDLPIPVEGMSHIFLLGNFGSVLISLFNLKCLKQSLLLQAAL